jgi:hypothetical protein
MVQAPGVRICQVIFHILIHVSVCKEDDHDLETDAVRSGSVRDTSDDVFSPAVEASMRRDLEPMNLTFTP